MLKDSVFWDVPSYSLVKVYFHRTAWQYIPEDRSLHSHHCGNLKNSIAHHWCFLRHGLSCTFASPFFSSLPKVLLYLCPSFRNSSIHVLACAHKHTHCNHVTASHILLGCVWLFCLGWWMIDGDLSDSRTMCVCVCGGGAGWFMVNVQTALCVHARTNACVYILSLTVLYF